MDVFSDPIDILALASMMLLLLLNAQRSLSLSMAAVAEEADVSDDCFDFSMWESSPEDIDMATHASLNHFTLFGILASIDEDLGFWVKPRSTTWFSTFLLQEYDDTRWLQMFRMTKRSVLTLTQLLAPSVKKQDTKYRLAVPVSVRIVCTLFKLSQGASLLICSELFAVGRSTVSKILREVVHAINITLRGEMSWPSGDAVVGIADDFQQLCGLPGIVGAIDGTHFAIGKPRVGASDYYYFKSGGYTMNCQAVVDSSKRFLDLYVGMPGSTNDARMLRRSTLFHRGQLGTLWEGIDDFNGFSPYLVGDAGYPLLPWLMVPHRRVGALSMAEQLFNRKLSKGRVVVENAFAFLKLSFRELQQRSDLHVGFLPDVVFCCAILHNVLLNQSNEAVESLLQVLRSQGERDNAADAVSSVEDDGETSAAVPDHVDGQQKRRDLGVYLSMQR